MSKFGVNCSVEPQIASLSSDDLVDNMIIKGQTECICTQDGTIGDQNALTDLLLQIKDPFFVIEEHFLSTTHADMSIDVRPSGGASSSSRSKVSKKDGNISNIFI
eukprot:3758685-Ditylum_brightwellii.AAC.1